MSKHSVTSQDTIYILHTSYVWVCWKEGGAQDLEHFIIGAPDCKRFI